MKAGCSKCSFGTFIIIPYLRRRKIALESLANLEYTNVYEFGGLSIGCMI